MLHRFHNEQEEHALNFDWQHEQEAISKQLSEGDYKRQTTQHHFPLLCHTRSPSVVTGDSSSCRALLRVAVLLSLWVLPLAFLFLCRRPASDKGDSHVLHALP